ncbi:MAG TPA: phosphatase PAP2 family protein [Nitrolancea sp.]|nr:phosphatase PAP2 family protein [Nitrolancea sp.]
MNMPRGVRVSTSILDRTRDGIAECGLMVALFMMYYVTRGVAAGKEAVAFGHAREVMHVEQRLGLFREIGLQTQFMTEPNFVRFLNVIYAYTHLAVIVAFAIWVFLFHADRYPMIRNTFLAVLGTGLIIYILFPLAPPRFFPYTGFVDTLQLYSGINYDQQSISMLYNPFAAMPSLHVGFALFSGIGLIQVGRRPIHWILGITYPLLMTIAVIGTANHYILDVIVGSFITIMAFILVPRVTNMVNARAGRRRQFESGTVSV